MHNQILKTQPSMYVQQNARIIINEMHDNVDFIVLWKLTMQCLVWRGGGVVTWCDTGWIYQLFPHYSIFYRRKCKKYVYELNWTCRYLIYILKWNTTIIEKWKNITLFCNFLIVNYVFFFLLLFITIFYFKNIMCSVQ